MSIPRYAFKRVIQQASVATRPAAKPRVITQSFTQITRPITTSSLQPWRAYRLPVTFQNTARRCASTTQPPPQPLPHRPAPHRDPNEPCYELTFTCKACRHRSAHTVSKQGYHKGTTLISCPGCKARHLISDHLHIFSDTKITLEDILAKKGETMQKGSINDEGDIEFWAEDGEPKAKV